VEGSARNDLTRRDRVQSGGRSFPRHVLGRAIVPSYIFPGVAILLFAAPIRSANGQQQSCRDQRSSREV